jgi:hypothetical protein
LWHALRAGWQEYLDKKHGKGGYLTGVGEEKLQQTVKQQQAQQEQAVGAAEQVTQPTDDAPRDAA